MAAAPEVGRTGAQQLDDYLQDSSNGLRPGRSVLFPRPADAPPQAIAPALP